MLINRNGSKWLIREDVKSPNRLGTGFVTRFDNRLLPEMTNESGWALRQSMMESGQLVPRSEVVDQRPLMTLEEVGAWRERLIKEGVLVPE